MRRKGEPLRVSSEAWRFTFEAPKNLNLIITNLMRPRLVMWLAVAVGIYPSGWLLPSAVAAPRLDWVSIPGNRSAAAAITSSSKVGFTLVPPAQSGVTFTNVLAEPRHLTNQILLNGSGVAAGDVDGDGWADLYFCSLDGKSRLYRNLGGWRFEDQTEKAGLAGPNISATGSALADIDGDGDLDLIVNSMGQGTHLFLNDSKGLFTKLPTLLNPGLGGMSLALGDLDGDGFLDLYIANYRTSALMDIPNARATFKTLDGKLAVDTFNGHPVSSDPALRDRFVIGPRRSIDEQGEPDAVYRNIGGTNFVAIPFTGGAFLDETGRPLSKTLFDWGLSVMIRDTNGDGLPDIYVCNDFQTEDRFWINQGGGRLRLLPPLAQRKSSLFSMGVDFADINRDGHEDLLVLDMLSRDHSRRMRDLTDGTPPLIIIGQIENRPQYSLNTLFLNRGDDTYAEIGQLSGLHASEWSWACLFLDVDLDGWEDVLISTGMERGARDLDVADRIKAMRAARRMSDAEIFEARRMFPRLATANLAFRNRGDLTFEEMGRHWGFDLAGISHGMALVDLDNDGDLDVVVSNLNDVAAVYRNEAGGARIAVRLRGDAPNTYGVGAKIKVMGGAIPMQSQEMISGGRYLSSDDPVRAFAAGSPTNEMTLEVVWRSGKTSVVRGAKANRIYEVAESAASADNGTRTATSGARPPPIFEDVSGLLQHQHVEEEFDDYARQPLLPKKLSQLGPGVAWFDVDADGWEDLIVGSGKGGQTAVFRNDGHGGFQQLKTPFLNQPVTRDQTTLLAWRKSASQAVLLAGSANYEEGSSAQAGVQQFDLSEGTTSNAVPGVDSSVGPLAIADLDGDGSLDLFVGGRVVPGKYPAAAASRMFRTVGGQFVLDTQNTKPLGEIGMVSGAVFTDIDRDGDPDLVLACEWGPPRLLLNEHGQLTDVTDQWGLARFSGWWNGVAVGDFDEDGRMDFVATNWGQNTRYQSHRTEPLQVYYGDFNGDGSMDLIETYYEPSLKKKVPERPLTVLSKALPFLRDRFSSHRAFSTAGIEKILGAQLKDARVWQARWLESTVFLNRGDHFETVALPAEAQFAPAFGVCTGDFDGDGHEDLVLAQNFFGAQSETPRDDSGRGLLLRGDGRGGFSAVPGQASGLKIYGEQRGAAVADYDGDGRLDVVIAQNGAATKLYRNTGGKPGLRVRLVGSPANPTAVGASLRLAFGERNGPLREVHAGSGYWSQDSAVQVMSTPFPPTRIEIRWPGGRRTMSEVPSSARAIRVTLDGEVNAGEQ